QRGKNCYLKLASLSSSFDRPDPPPSIWLLAAGPFLAVNLCRPIQGILNLFKLGCSVTGFGQACCIYASKWSCKFSPPPGKSTTVSIPRLSKCSFSPTPDN